MPVIGYLGSGSAESEAPVRGSFLKGLEQSGFLAGRNVGIEYRFAEGRFERLPTLAAELVRLPATVLVASGVPAAVSAKKETATIPIVFVIGLDPVSLGLVESLSRPGGNATGVSVFTTELGPSASVYSGKCSRRPGWSLCSSVREQYPPRSRSTKWKPPPERSGSPFWFCTPKARAKPRKPSR